MAEEEERESRGKEVASRAGEVGKRARWPRNRHPGPFALIVTIQRQFVTGLEKERRGRARVQKRNTTRRAGPNKNHKLRWGRCRGSRVERNYNRGLEKHARSRRPFLLTKPTTINHVTLLFVALLILLAQRCMSPASSRFFLDSRESGVFGQTLYSILAPCFKYATCAAIENTHPCNAHEASRIATSDTQYKPRATLFVD